MFQERQDDEVLKFIHDQNGNDFVSFGQRSKQQEEDIVEERPMLMNLLHSRTF
jgi:hypothetical protein